MLKGTFLPVTQYTVLLKYVESKNLTFSYFLRIQNKKYKKEHRKHKTKLKVNSTLYITHFKTSVIHSGSTRTTVVTISVTSRVSNLVNPI